MIKYVIFEIFCLPLACGLLILKLFVDDLFDANDRARYLGCPVLGNFILSLMVSNLICYIFNYFSILYTYGV